MHCDLYEIGAKLERSHWWFVARRHILRRLADRILPSSGANIVDIGCGTGGNTAMFQTEHQCVGVDLSEDAVRIARTEWPDSRFVHCPEAADFGPLLAEADLCLLTDVLEHVPDDVRLFSEVVANAKSGSHLLLTVPADVSLWSLHDETHGHYRRYDRARLECLWNGLPVTPLLVSYFNSRLYPLIHWIRRRNRRRARAHGQAGTDLSPPPMFMNSVLKFIFASESRRLLALLSGTRKVGFRRGVSLVALLRREHDLVGVGGRPAEVHGDHVDSRSRHEQEGVFL